VNVPVAGFNFGALAARNRDTKGKAYEVYANKEVLKNTIAYAEVGHADEKNTSTIPKAGTGFAVGVIYIF
jgi:hypothetical protein